MKIEHQYQSYLIISYRDGRFYLEKNLYGQMGETDLMGVLQALLPFTGKFKPIMEVCISKLESYLPFV